MIIARYEQAIRSLHGAALAVNRKPSDYAAALELQLAVLRKLKYLEKRIHTRKEYRRQLRSQLKGRRTTPLSKEEASRLKARINQCEHAQREYQFLIDLVKTFADAVAFTYLDKWDIKPLGFRPRLRTSERKGRATVRAESSKRSPWHRSCGSAKRSYPLFTVR